MLVTRHYRKLYAPRDYRHDSSFLKLSTEEAEIRLEQELEEALPDIKPIDYRQSYLTNKIDKAQYKHIEEKAISLLENRLGISAERNVKLMPTGVAFDAVHQSYEKVVAIEVKILDHPYLPSSIYKILYDGELADNFLPRFELIIAIVCLFQKEQINDIESKFKRAIVRSLYPVRLEFIPLQELQN